MSANPDFENLLNCALKSYLFVFLSTVAGISGKRDTYKFQVMFHMSRDSTSTLQQKKESLYNFYFFMSTNFELGGWMTCINIIQYFFPGELLKDFSEIFLGNFNGSFFYFPLKVGLFSRKNQFSVGKLILIYLLCKYFPLFAHVRIRTLHNVRKNTLFSTFCSCANSHTSVRKKKL